MDINDIIQENRKYLTLARNLNLRAGKKIFLELDKNELREWLKERIGCAKSLKEIPDLNKIRLPALDPIRVQEVIDGNPDEIELFGNGYSVDYAQETPSISIELFYFLNFDFEKFGKTSFTLPSGRRFEIIVRNGIEKVAAANCVEDLIEVINRFSNIDRMKALMAKAQSEFAVSGIRDRDQILALFPKLENPAIIVEGETVTYQAFDYGKHSGSGICLFEDYERAKWYTENSLQEFYSEETQNAISIPRSDVFYESLGFMRRLNLLGVTLQGHLNRLHKKHSEDLDVGNIVAKIGEFKKEANDIVSDCEKYAGLYSGLQEINFKELINRTRIEELSAILASVQDLTGFTEAEVVKGIYLLTKNEKGIVKRGNKLWMELRDNFPGKVHGVDPDDISLAILDF